MMTSADVVERIRKERKKKGMSLRAFGEILEVSGQYVSMIERGKAPLRMEDYFKICNALEISPIKLFIQEERKNNVMELEEKLYTLSERDFHIFIKIMELMK